MTMGSQLVTIPPITVSTNVFGPLTASDLCETQNGQLVYVWVDGSTIQRSVRSPLGIQLKPQEEIAQLQENTAVKMQPLDNGNYIVLFAKNSKILFQIFNENHTAIESETEAFPNLAANQTDPDTTRLANGRIVISCTYDQFPIATGQTGLGITYQGWDAAMTTASSTYKGTCYNDNQGAQTHGRIAFTLYGGFECIYYAHTPDTPYRQRINTQGYKNQASTPASDTTGFQDHPVITHKTPDDYTHAWAVKDPSDPDKVTAYAFAIFSEEMPKLSSDYTLSVPKTHWPQNSTLSYLQVVDDPRDGFVIITREQNLMVQRRFHTNATQNGTPLNLSNTALQVNARALSNGWGVILIESDKITARSFLYDVTLPTPSPTPEPTLYPTFEPTSFPTLEPTNLPTTDPTPFPTFEPTYLPTTEPTPFTPSPTEQMNLSTRYSKIESSDSSNTAVIIGSIIAGLALSSLLASIFYYLRSKPRSTAPTPLEPQPESRFTLSGLKGKVVHITWDNPEEAPTRAPEKPKKSKKPIYDQVPLPGTLANNHLVNYSALPNTVNTYDFDDPQSTRRKKASRSGHNKPIPSAPPLDN